MPLTISTPRLDLIAAQVDHLDIEIHAPELLCVYLGVTVPAGWPPGLYDEDAMYYFRKQLKKLGEPAVGWFGWYAIRRESPATLVAAAGFMGPPEAGMVEIGYSVVEQFRRQGFATEMIGALCARAFSTPDVHTVMAQVAADNEASIGALKRAGFRKIGAGTDPGTLRFERHAGGMATAAAT